MCGFDRERLLLAPEKRRVVTGPRRQTTAIQFDDPRGKRLEEDAIVRHEQDSAGVVRQKSFEPSHRVDVEVIGRLIEQE
jgi:hypothetical protein